MHLCWGNYAGPHTTDVPIERLFDMVIAAQPSAMSFEAANPRHEYEWETIATLAIPEDKILMPGVIDTKTNVVEHHHKLTREMLDQMKPITDTRPIGSLVNTHANGDHCFGNELVPDRTKIYATIACAEEMSEVPPLRLEGLKENVDFAGWAFGDFDFSEIRGRQPDETFDTELILMIGGRR